MAREPSELAFSNGFGRLRSYKPGQLARAEREALPDLVLASGPSAPRRFVEFFAAQIRNKNTRIAYAQAVGQFLDFAEKRGVTQLRQLSPLLVAAYVESHPGRLRRKISTSPPSAASATGS